MARIQTIGVKKNRHNPVRGTFLMIEEDFRSSEFL
jgi:hypothetical protein